MVKTWELGPGAELGTVRSGEVIPKLVGVHVPSKDVRLLELCPSCGGELVWKEDFLRCMNFGGVSGTGCSSNSSLLAAWGTPMEWVSRQWSVWSLWDTQVFLLFMR